MSFQEINRRRRAEAEARRASQETIRSSGVGESRVFSAPEGSFEAKQMDWSQLTINQAPIPQHLWGLVPYEMTDQGVAEKNEGKEPARASVLSDPIEKHVAERKDAVKSRGMASWEAPDVRKEVAEKHVKPGFKARLLSPRKVELEGTRGWEPVTDRNGDPVKVGNLILGQMPEAKVAQRNKHYRDQANARLQREAEGYQEQQARLLRESGISPDAVRPRSGEDGLQIAQGNDAGSTDVQQFFST
jgi:hypothetical protein